MGETIMLDRVNENLGRLKLRKVMENLPALLQVAEKQQKSHLGFLDDLLEEETSQKEQRRIETSLRISGLPFIKTIDEYDFCFQPTLDRQKVLSLFDLTFLSRKDNVMLLGPPGVGKTHLAVALAVKACHSGISIYFTTMAGLIEKLKNDHQAGKTSRGRGYAKAALVIVDEVGYTSISREECNLFYRFVDNRYEKNSTIMTSNKSFADWTELFEDPIIVTAVLDRLLHHSVIINIDGPSFRLKGKKIKMTPKKEVEQKNDERKGVGQI